MGDINVIVEQIDDTVIVEVSPINDEVNVIIGSVVNKVGDIFKHSQLDLDDGTNPHGTTKTDVGLSDVPNTDFTSAVALNTTKVGVTNEEENTIDSIVTGEPTGSDRVINVVSLLQSEYNAGTPISTTFYIITDA
jgi:hypothetical protein